MTSAVDDVHTSLLFRRRCNSLYNYDRRSAHDLVRFRMRIRLARISKVGERPDSSPDALGDAELSNTPFNFKRMNLRHFSCEAGVDSNPAPLLARTGLSGFPPTVKRGANNCVID